MLNNNCTVFGGTVSNDTHTHTQCTQFFDAGIDFLEGIQ